MYSFGHGIIQYGQIHHHPIVLTHVEPPTSNSSADHSRGISHSQDTAGIDGEVEEERIPVAHHSLSE